MMYYLNKCQITFIIYIEFYPLNIILVFNEHYTSIILQYGYHYFVHRTNNNTDRL